MKIAMGMGIAAFAYLFLVFFSLALPDKAALAGMKADEVQSILVTPWVMVGLYFILTVAELFISPLGLAFVSKVAPPHMQGLMQGFWLAATAVGNALLFVGGWLYIHTPMWTTWTVFVVACGLSMLVMLAIYMIVPQPKPFHTAVIVKIAYHLSGEEYQETGLPPNAVMIELRMPRSASRNTTSMPEMMIQEIKFGRYETD